MTIYSYQTYDLPSELICKSAEEILPSSYLRRFITDKKPNMAHFADYFRLTLFRKMDYIWVDCDVLCLSWPDQSQDHNIIIRTAAGGVINCVLRIGDPAVLDLAIARTEQLLDRDLPWAATQDVIPGSIKASGKPVVFETEATLCPIGVDDWYKPLLPAHFDECRDKCKAAKTLHLYNNILQKAGFLKSALPPRESYLRHLLDDMGYADRFCGEYDVSTIENLSNGWALRFSGASIGFGAVMRQIIPSARRTFARRRHTSA